MTKIYIYCLFDGFDTFLGVYSSLKSVHRDALKYCNKGYTKVYMIHENIAVNPSLGVLRNVFKGKCDTQIEYRTNLGSVKIFKTKLKE